MKLAVGQRLAQIVVAADDHRTSPREHLAHQPGARGNTALGKVLDIEVVGRYPSPWRVDVFTKQADRASVGAEQGDAASDHLLQHRVDLAKFEEKMEPELAEKIYELDRCIECGCCVAACGTARMREDFVGAVGLNKIARFRLDPRDRRNDDDYYEFIGDDDGVFGCMSLIACHDVCPKELPLATQIAFLRRKMVSVGWK